MPSPTGGTQPAGLFLVIEKGNKLNILVQVERDFKPSGEVRAASDHLPDLQQGQL